ncbi:hypothetical protein ABH15_01960 [Methanoculleus taiwanensis]|uniref:Uncharacterized protein n=1 Tax=Methanoculleus taiwanensis TaxID=1550565 RepID=A0A498H401_9EURY|nr:hypothetical protein [Methanoculleus taiwanensis]RXE56935.1 hypothetical protein ABH15_01960 [Methanoculleus taiwanensis]
MRRALIGTAAFCLLLLLICSPGCIGQSIPQPSAPMPDFRAESVGYDDRIVFRFIPDTGTPATYFVTYEIIRNGTTVRSETQTVYNAVDRSNPIAFTVQREPGDSVVIEITIVNADGWEVYASGITVRSSTDGESAVTGGAVTPTRTRS